MAATGEKTAAQRFALGFGAFYVVLGLVGFAFTAGCPMFAECQKGIGPIQLNLFHNVAHLGIGAMLVLAANMSNEVAKGTLLGVGSFYLIVAIIGVTGALLNFISVPPGLSGDNFFHAISAAVLLFAGVGSEQKSKVAS